MNPPRPCLPLPGVYISTLAQLTIFEEKFCVRRSLDFSLALMNAKSGSVVTNSSQAHGPTSISIEASRKISL
jgi:hypothetical protein